MEPKNTSGTVSVLDPKRKVRLDYAIDTFSVNLGGLTSSCTKSYMKEKVFCS